MPQSFIRIKCKLYTINFIRTFSCNLHLITKNDMKDRSWTWFWFFVFVTQLFLEMVFLLHHKPIKKSLRERILYDSRITDVYKVRNKMQRQAVFNLEMNMYVWVNESITSIWGYINRPMKSAQVILYIFKLVLHSWLYTSLLVLILANEILTTYLITKPRF